MPFAIKRPSRSPSREAPRAPGSLENLPKWAIVCPLLFQWIWLGVRYRSLTLPSVANPRITAGGLVGEGKMEYFEAMGPLALGFTAECGSFEVVRGRTEEDAVACMEQHGLRFPLIAKPNIGWCGFGVRRIPSHAALREYLADFPVGERLVLQTYVPDEGEAGIFYVRLPGEAQGRLTGLALRHFPRVVGDGVHTVDELAAADPRLQRLRRDANHVHSIPDTHIPAVGTSVRLAVIGSTRVGGLYEDGSRHMTPALAKTIDTIAQDMGAFHFGRFDVRFRDLAGLRAGRGFQIIEVNGAGSEAIEAWDPGLALGAAFRTIFRKQALLFKVADANRNRGHRPLPVRDLARLHFKQQRLIPRYPRSN